MKFIRKNLKYVFPILILIMVVGLVLSRVYHPKKAIPEPEIHISAEEAIDHIGTPAEVCGHIVSARYLPQMDGKPTFLNFGQPDPNQLFTVVIWGEDRLKWKADPEQEYINRHICATGLISSHEGTPQIIVHSPDQISIQRNE